MRPTRSVRPVIDVQHAAARLELARVDAEVGELADEGVGHDLERERREGLVVGRLARRGRALVLALDGLEALDRRDVERARQVVDHRVEQRLHALVLEGGAASTGVIEMSRVAWRIRGLQALGLDRASPRGSPP